MTIQKPIARYRDEDNEYDIITVHDDSEGTFQEFRYYPDKDGVMIIAHEGSYEGPMINLSWDEWLKIDRLVKESRN